MLCSLESMHDGDAGRILRADYPDPDLMKVGEE
jgi:hypothetical protein